MATTTEIVDDALVDFLLVSINEDVEQAPNIQPQWRRERALAEIEAKRRILQMHRPVLSYRREDCEEHRNKVLVLTSTRADCPDCSMVEGAVCKRCEDEWPCPEVKAIALPYADKDDYREEWEGWSVE